MQLTGISYLVFDKVAIWKGISYQLGEKVKPNALSVSWGFSIPIHIQLNFKLFLKVQKIQTQNLT